MGLQTHIGPQLLGTVKNNNPAIVTTNNPLASETINGTVTSFPGSVWNTFLGTGQTNGIRNLGVGDGTQFGSFAMGTASFPTAQTGVSIPNLDATTGAGKVSSVTFYPGVYTTGPTGGPQFQPIVMPAGTYVAAIVFDIVTAFTTNVTGGTSTTAINLAINAVNTSGTVTNLVNHGGVVSPTAPAVSISTAWGSAQRNQVGSGSGLTIPSTAVPYMVNTGNTDTIIQCVLTATLGTATVLNISNGSGYLGINYTIRNADGSWYPQTPIQPISNPPTVTY